MAYIIWGTKYAKLFQNITASKEKIIYTVEKITNKWLEETVSLKVK